MPILVKCDCGHEITVADTMAGKKGRCPECDAILGIPRKGGRRPPRGGAYTPMPTSKSSPYRFLSFLSGTLSALGFIGLFGFAILGVYTGVQVLAEAEAFKDVIGVFEGYRNAARDNTTVTGVAFMVAGLGLGGLSFLLFIASAQLLRLFVALERSLLSIADHLSRPD